MISYLVKKGRKNPDYFDELIKERNQKEEERTSIAEKISEISEDTRMISSIPRM